MDARSKSAVYAFCGAAGLAFLISVWAVAKATRASLGVNGLRERDVAELKKRVDELELAYNRQKTLSEGRFKTVEADINEFFEKVKAIRAGREEAKEYANRKHKDALDTLEERLRAFGRERDEKARALGGKIEDLRQTMEKRVEDRCDKLEKYVQRRLSTY